ncbi:hypothetical protein RHAB21_04221 [Pseudorhizobium halotolerans]|uniref:Uncharacterized protein n=1 Tax=Pseudorhizobium halotolerans TaxID=1233081 RepID=A0ABM8PVL0_9HYPH|nr:hypothetical protein [Pseudorhizobium halotolerans]CAD7050821.1 hypothetical protein RHAB21_04221 [Pseudorhizobium halotolerans]
MGHWSRADRAKGGGVFFLILFLLGVSGCFRDEEVQFKDSRYPLLSDLYNRFDPEKPGFGTADYPGFDAVDIPKAYAQVLLAEVERNRHGLLPEFPSLAAVSGRWLLDHDDIDGDGIVGWGVPIAWDAYGDGSENPANTVYTISTAIAVDALMTWMERDPTSPKAEIFETVTAALRPFTNPRLRSPSGLMPYSFQDSDLVYDTFNPAAYMAGQLQRFSLLTDDVELREALRSVADNTVQVLLDQHRVNEATGSWYWHYSIQEDVANDLPHANYIIDGLMKYRHYGGRLGNRIDMEAALSHLREFSDTEAGYVRAWPKLQKNIDRPARTYDLGIAMSLTCAAPGMADLSPVLAAELPKYRDADGFLKYPKGTNFADELVVNEYEAYLYRGIVDCTLYEERRVPKEVSTTRPQSAETPNSSVSHMLAAGADGGITVPFVSPAEGKPSTVNARGDLPLNMTLREPNRPEIVFGKGEIPIASHDLGTRRAIFVRSMPGNELSLAVADEAGNLATRFPIQHSSDSQPIFRASTVQNGEVYLVYYDNISLNNYLARYAVQTQNVTQVGQSLKLPLLQDPAGGTYEMIPGVFLFPVGTSEIALVGGTLNGRYSSEEGFHEKRVDNCLRAVEAVAAPRGPVILCQARTSVDGRKEFFLVGPEGQPLPQLGEDSVPFDVRFKSGGVKVDFAADPDGYARMLRFDLQRIQQNGWMEFGTNNDEGRIPWSQIYYLSGMLDFLLIAQNEPGIGRAFADLLEDMRVRLDMEMLLIDWHWREGRYKTRGFTVDRSPALFAVQSSRLVLLMDRYLSELAHPLPLPGYQSARQAMHCLTGHIDMLQRGGEPVWWMQPGNASLRWPKGSSFYFDGLAVPYNHQNEWAYAVRRTEAVPECAGAKDAGAEIIAHFMRHIAPMGIFPNDGSWNYWWGTAYDGWNSTDGVSLNMPSYGGDKIKAWISFRTMDLMAVLAHLDTFDAPTRHHLLRSVRHQIYNGHVYPFANYELQRQGEQPILSPRVARHYARVSSPWELQSAAWAYRALVSQP